MKLNPPIVLLNQRRCAICLRILTIATTLCWMKVNAQPSSSQPDWSSFQFLLGEWTGEGSGDPGQGAGTFTFSMDLQDHVIIRRNQSDYPATKTHPAFSHNDLMVIYQESGKPASAMYFDNEGHTIQYHTAFSADGKSMTFTSDSLPAAPRFQLTYTSLAPELLLITFEIAPPSAPNHFTKYLEGKAHRSGTVLVIPSEGKQK